MYYEPHIRFVNSHTEGVGSNHNAYVIEYKSILHALSLLSTHSGVIFRRRNPPALQQIIQIVDIFSRRAINYSAVPLMLRNIIQNILLFFLRLLHLKKQILPVKSGDKGIRIDQPERTHNIVPDILRRRRRKCADYRSPVKQPHELHYLHVAWSEILPPLRYTVCFIHGKHRYPYILCKLQKAVRNQTLRRYIDNLVHTLPRSVDRLIKHIFRK